MFSSNSSHRADVVRSDLYPTPDIDEASFFVYNGLAPASTEALSPTRVVFSFPRTPQLDTLVVDFRNSNATVEIELHRYVAAKREVMAHRSQALAGARGGFRG